MYSLYYVRIFEWARGETVLLNQVLKAYSFGLVHSSGFLSYKAQNMQKLVILQVRNLSSR